MKPPDKEKWKELGLLDKCTCKEYEWEEEVCPYIEEIHEKETLCRCCPYHVQDCLWSI